ncbi:hypothetical protein SFRURICE_019952, partial [Spodoptera frugiperda]
MICSACTNNLQPGDAFLECAAEACNKVYHYLCNNRELTIEERAVWVCPECSCAARKGGRSCEEPIPIHTPLVLKNVSLRNKSNPPLLQSPDNYSTNQEVFLLREQMNVLTEQLIDAMAVITQYQTALADCTKKVEIVCDKLNKLEQSCKCGCAAVCKKVTVTQSEAANIVILEPFFVISRSSPPVQSMLRQILLENVVQFVAKLIFELSSFFCSHVLRQLGCFDFEVVLSDWSVFYRSSTRLRMLIRLWFLVSEIVDDLTVCEIDGGGLVPRRDAYHPPLEIAFPSKTISVKPVLEKHNPSNIKPQRDWNFSKGNYELLYELVSQASWQEVLCAQNVDTAVENFYHVLYNIFDTCIPRKHRSKKPSRRYP